MTTGKGKLGASGPDFARLTSFVGRAGVDLPAVAPQARKRIVRSYVKDQQITTEYPANGSFFVPRTRSIVCTEIEIWSSLTAD